MSNTNSPSIPAGDAGNAATVWAEVTVNRGGPIENGGLYVMLTDNKGSFKSTWFYVKPEIAALVNQSSTAAMCSNKKAQVELTGITPASAILRFHLIA